MIVRDGMGDEGRGTRGERRETSGLAGQHFSGSEDRTGGDPIVNRNSLIVHRQSKKHWVTRLTEFFSIRLFGFNKAEHGVNFPTEQQMLDFAARHGMKAEWMGNRVSSNVVWVFRRE